MILAMSIRLMQELATPGNDILNKQANLHISISIKDLQNCS